MAKRKWRPETERDRSMRAYEQNPRAYEQNPRAVAIDPRALANDLLNEARRARP